MLVLLTSVLMATSVLAADTPSAAKGDKDKVVRQIVDNWIQIGTEQYKRGFYAAAEKSFMRAKDYEESLTTEERAKLNESLQMAHKAAVAQEAVPAAKPEAKPVVEQPKEKVVVEVNEVAEPAPEVTVAPPSVQPEQDQGYIGVINKRISIIRSRVKAVVNDSTAKAEGFIAQGQFDKAKETVEVAERTVYESQQQLGDYLFNQYSGQLKQLSERIADGQKTQAQQKEDEKRTKAESSQKEYREQMSSEREKRISDLFQNARNFEKQKRYEDALSQVEMLLALDPQNNEALIEKQMLEDNISYRKEIDVEKEKSSEKFKTTVKTDEAMIPFADEMTHPKNWREIINKPMRQQPEEVIGQEPASASVEKQLDQVVNLPGLSPEMPLREAINLIKNSVSPPLNITVQWGDLYNNANIEQTAPINMDPLTNVPVRTALDLLLRSVSAGLARLGYVVQDGVVIVATTTQPVPTINMPIRVYDVTVLLGRPADYYVSSSSGQGQGGGGQSQSGGSSGGSGGGYYQETFNETDTDLDRATLLTDAQNRMTELINLIQDTIDTESWDVAGGASITAYGTNKLVVRQTLKNHRDIEELLKNMRKNLGNQISIEARFLVVGENFLEEIGLDSFGNLFLGNTFGTAQWQTNSFQMAEPVATGIDGGFDISKSTVQFPVSSSPNPPLISTGALMAFFGGRFGGVLDNLEANFLIRATQANRDSESLVAPKVTVLSGESATLQVIRTIRFALPPNVSAGSTTSTSSSTIASSGTGVTNQFSSVPTGPTLNITPTITPDRKHVLLDIKVELQDFLGFDTSTFETPFASGNTIITYPYTIQLPQTERSRVQTRVSVPDSGTLLLGGLKQTKSIETEVGVPVLSKIPVLGRLFTNRSKVADKKILLILVKPTIILQEESDAEAVAAMEGQQ